MVRVSGAGRLVCWRLATTHGTIWLRTINSATSAKTHLVAVIDSATSGRLDAANWRGVVSGVSIISTLCDGRAPAG